MSKASVMAFVDKVLSDPAFFAKFESDPDGALAGFDLTTEEVAAIKSRNSARLMAIGLDERISKGSLN